MDNEKFRVMGLNTLERLTLEELDGPVYIIPPNREFSRYPNVVTIKFPSTVVKYVGRDEAFASRMPMEDYSPSLWLKETLPTRMAVAEAMETYIGTVQERAVDFLKDLFVHTSRDSDFSARLGMPFWGEGVFSGELRIPTGTLVRLDTLPYIDSRGVVRWKVVDPNFVPLGFAFLAKLHSESGGYTKYLEVLARAYDKLVFVTGLKYPNWPSHLFTAKLLKQMGVSVMFLVPQANTEDLKTINKELGLDYMNIESGTYDPRLGIIYHVRDLDLYVKLRELGVIINPPWIRALEQQGNMAFLDSQSLFVSTALVVSFDTLRYVLNGEITENIKKLVYLWEELDQQEKERDRECFVKSLDTSGSKGVLRVPIGRDITGFPQKFWKEIKKARERGRAPLVVNSVDSGLPLVIQPKIRNVVEEPTLGRVRAKADLFVVKTPEGWEVLEAADLMVLPVGSVKAHGTGVTRFYPISLNDL